MGKGRRMTIVISGAMERAVDFTGIAPNHSILTDLAPPSDCFMIYIAFRATTLEAWEGGLFIDYALWSGYPSVAAGVTLTGSNAWQYHSADGKTWRVGQGVGLVLAVTSSNTTPDRSFDRICVQWVREVADDPSSDDVIIDDMDDGEAIEDTSKMLIGVPGGGIFAADVSRVKALLTAGRIESLIFDAPSGELRYTPVGGTPQTVAIGAYDAVGKLDTDLGNVGNPSTIEERNFKNAIHAADDDLGNLDSSLSDSEKETIRNKVSAERAPITFTNSNSTGSSSFDQGDRVWFTDIRKLYICRQRTTIQLRLIKTSPELFALAHPGAEDIVDALEGLTGNDRLNASAIRNLPDSDVSTDGTLTGDGSTGDPLRVDNEFTQSDESKLDSIDPGAKFVAVNPSGAATGDEIATLQVGTTVHPLPTGGGVGGGLDRVHSDSTLSGVGTSDSHLRVANPFTNSDESKLDGIESNAKDDQTPQEIYDAVDGIAQQGWALPGTLVAANRPDNLETETLDNIDIGGTVYAIPSPTAGSAVLVKYFQSAGKVVAQKLGDLAATGVYTPETVPHYVAQSGGYTLAIVNARDFSAEILNDNLYIGGGGPPDDGAGQSTFFVRSLSDLPDVTQANLGHQFYVLQDGLERVAINDPVVTTAPNGTFNAIAPRPDLHVVEALPATATLGYFYYLNSGDEHEGWYRWINFGGSVHDYEETTGRAALALSRTVNTQHAEWLGAFASTEDALEFTHSIEATTDYFYLDTTDDTIKILQQSTFADAGTVYDHFQWRIIGGQEQPAPSSNAWTLLYTGAVNFTNQDTFVLPNDSVPVPDNAVTLLLNFGAVTGSAVTRSGEFFEIPANFWREEVEENVAGARTIGGTSYLLIRDFIRTNETSNLVGRDIQIGRTAANEFLFGSESSSEDVHPVHVYYKT